MSETPLNYALSPRFDKGLAKAVEIHRKHARKGSGAPYVGHLLSVAGLVLEDGGTEDEAIAALLHDAIEDQNYKGLEADLTEAFGDKVVAIVKGCSHEQSPGEDLTWRERKQRYIDHLESEKRQEVFRVSLADKLSNLRSVLRDYHDEEEDLWTRFNFDDPSDLGWYYGTLSKLYARRIPGAMQAELAHEVLRLQAIPSVGSGS